MANDNSGKAMTGAQRLKRHRATGERVCCVVKADEARAELLLLRALHGSQRAAIEAALVTSARSREALGQLIGSG